MDNKKSYSLEHINHLMPVLLAQKHDELIQKYNRTGESEVLNKKMV